MPDDAASIARAARATLLAQDAAATDRMAAAYSLIQQDLLRRLDELVARIEEAKAAGQPVTISWLLQEQRYRELLRQADVEAQRFGLGTAAQEMRRGRMDGVAQGAADAIDQLQTFDRVRVAGGFNQLSTGAIQAMTSRLPTSTRSMASLAALGENLSHAVAEALITGVGTGRAPREIARDIHRVTAVPLQTAMTVVRTETMTAYREATRATYQQNGDVVSKWRWLAALGARSCPVCIAMHGSVHELSEPFGSHPNCRCTMIPVLIGEEEAPYQTGEEWLGKQSAETQEEVLGVKAAQAWRSGAVRLGDFVHEREDEHLGLVRSVQSLASARKAAGERRGNKPPALPVLAMMPATQAVILQGENLRRTLSDVLNAVSDLHRVPAIIRPIPVQFDRDLKPRGEFQYLPNTSEKPIPFRILLHEFAGPDRELADYESTFLHEFGHYLDQQGWSGGGWASAESPELEKWRQAVEETRAIQELRRLRELDTVRIEQASGMIMMVPKNTINYLLRPHEVWARCYTQYVASQSEHPVLVAQLNDSRKNSGQWLYLPRQWEDDDFEKIAEAMTELFQRRGWRK